MLGPIATAAQAEPPGRSQAATGLLRRQGLAPPPQEPQRRPLVHPGGGRAPQHDADGAARDASRGQLRQRQDPGSRRRVAGRCVWWLGLPAAVDEFIKTCATYQRVKADHQAPPGLLFPLSVPTRRGGFMSLDFLELPAALRSRLPAGAHRPPNRPRWLVPTLKTASSETATRNFVASVFRDLGLEDVLVSDSDTRFTSASGPGCTPRSVPRSPSASLTTTTRLARSRASTASLPMCCAPLPASGWTTGTVWQD
jgi:hypothetical protein